jgi:aminoglycoside phosphotransferase (APT) family kinase protein
MDMAASKDSEDPVQVADRWRPFIDPIRLARWMDDRGLGHGPLEGASLLTGGTQNLLLRFRRADRDFVLRRPPVHLRPNSNEAMLREARVLGALAGTAVPHPCLIATCEDMSVIGTSFYLMEAVDGFNATVSMPPLHSSDATVRRDMGFVIVDAAAALGRVDYVSKGLADFGRIDGYLERQVGRWKSQLAGYAEFTGWPGPGALPDVDRLCAWLDTHRPKTFVPGIIHGDYHLANVMFDYRGPRLAAVIDWELSTLGDPLLDLGWLLATWPDPVHEDRPPLVRPWDGFPTASQLVDRYADRSGRDVAAVPWFAVLACFKLGAILEGTFARSCAGLAPVETGNRLHAQTVSLFNRAGRFIDAAGGRF